MRKQPKREEIGNKDKRGRKKEKEGRGFGRLPSFIFLPFLLVSHNFFCRFFRF